MDNLVLYAICPCCGEEASANAVHSRWGAVFVGQLLPDSLRAHADCDLVRLDRVLRAEAVRASKVLVFQVASGGAQ